MCKCFQMKSYLVTLINSTFQRFPSQSKSIHHSPKTTKPRAHHIHHNPQPLCPRGGDWAVRRHHHLRPPPLSPPVLNDEPTMVTAQTTAMAMHNLKTPIPKAPNTKRVIAFTTPENYAARLFHLLGLRGWIPLWCPTVSVATTPHTTASLLLHLSNANPSAAQPKPSLNHFSAIAFTSRTGIAAFSEALDEIENPPLASSGEIFTVCALGKDSELLNEAFANRICENSERIRVLVPPIATPAGMVEALGWGVGRRVLCPVPVVVGLEEPPVVPDFLRDLAAKGWVPVKVDGYETRWAGAECAAAVVARGEEGEGLEMVVAAHGPVTAAGAERLGVVVDVVSSRFGSFGGVVDALALRWEPLER